MRKVNLIGITKPSAITECSTAEELIAYCARVSNPTNQLNKKTAPKLIKYLLKNKHISPFEMVHVIMEITTSRDISRQILRHRSFSFQEKSGRYSLAAEFTDYRECRLQDTENRQNSLENHNKELAEMWNRKQQSVINLSNEVYNWAIQNNIAKEQARAVLPEGLTQSRLYMSGTLRSWIHYIETRCDKSTQKEHREIAEECKDIILFHFPVLGEYFENSNLDKSN